MTWITRQRWWIAGMQASLAALGLTGTLFTVKATIIALNSDSWNWAGFLPGILLTACFWLCCFIGAFYGWLGFHHWRESRRVLKNFHSADRRVMAVLCRISEANQVVYGSKALMLLTALASVTAAILLQEPRWLGIALMVAALRGWLWVRVTTPPFILFLSSSDSLSVGIHRQLKRLVSPLRVVTLLALEKSPSAETADELLLDCLRTSNTDDWKKVIYVLIDMAPVVIINADAETAGVHEEAIYITTNKLMFKTAFMTQSDARLLRLQPEPAASASSCFVVPTSKLRELIIAVLNSAELPAKSRDIRSFVPQHGTRG